MASQGSYLGAVGRRDDGDDEFLDDAQKNAPGPPGGSQEAWAITEHLCRVCFSRLLAVRGHGVTHYRCSGCGLSENGRTPSCLCACGIKLPRSTRNAGIRCVKNDHITPETPFEFVARQVVT